MIVFLTFLDHLSTNLSQTLYAYLSLYDIVHQWFYLAYYLLIDELVTAEFFFVIFLHREVFFRFDIGFLYLNTLLDGIFLDLLHTSINISQKYHSLIKRKKTWMIIEMKHNYEIISKHICLLSGLNSPSLVPCLVAGYLYTAPQFIVNPYVIIFQFFSSSVE